jgi:hypothetical protein
MPRSVSITLKIERQKKHSLQPGACLVENFALRAMIAISQSHFSPNVSGMERQSRNRIVIETPRGRPSRGARRPARPSAPVSREGLVAVSVIAAAALATFIALFLTSRPYDPMSSTVAPQQEVPPSALSLQSSPKPFLSPSATPAQATATPATPSEPTGQTSGSGTDDAAIQAEIERRIAGAATLSGLDVSTIVEGGKVTLVGSVRSPELKIRFEKAVRSIKGVISVDNQLVVTEPTPSATDFSL